MGKTDEIRILLQKTARPLLVPFGVAPCGADTPTSRPNNHYGHGELDIDAAVRSCLETSGVAGDGIKMDEKR